MQKIITVATIPTVKNNTNFTELSFPEINKLLNEGYTVKEVHQLAPTQNSFGAIITFVLESRKQGSISA